MSTAIWVDTAASTLLTALCRVTSNLRFLLVSGAASHPATWASTLQIPSSQTRTPPSASPARVGQPLPPLHGQGGYILPRGLRSKQVIKQTVLPIASCSFATLLWAMTEVYTQRDSRLLILQRATS